MVKQGLSSSGAGSPSDRLMIIAEGGVGNDALFLDDQLRVFGISPRVSLPNSPLNSRHEFNHKCLFVPYDQRIVPRVWKSFLSDFDDGFPNQHKIVSNLSGDERRLRMVSHAVLSGEHYFLDDSLNVFGVAGDVRTPHSPVADHHLYDNMSFYRNIVPSFHSGAIYRSLLDSIEAGHPLLEEKLERTIIPSYEALGRLENKKIKGSIRRRLDGLAFRDVVDVSSGEHPSIVAMLKEGVDAYILTDDARILSSLDRVEFNTVERRVNVLADDAVRPYAPVSLHDAHRLYSSFASMLEKGSPLRRTIEYDMIPFFSQVKKLPDREKKVPAAVQASLYMKD